MPEMQVQEIQKSIGETLAEERKQRNLSVQEVATQLRLDPRIIEALEAENYEILPSPAYTRGYLRSYAKILSLDADRIISQYNNKAPQPPEIIPDVKHPTQVSSRDKPVQAFTYLVSFILVLLVLAWVQSNFVVRESPPAPAAVTPEPQVSAPQQPDLEPYAVQGAEPNVNDGQGGEVEMTSPLTEQEGTQALEQFPVTTETEQAASSDIKRPAPQQIPDQPETSLALKVDESQDAHVGDGTTGPDSINMKLSANSWIEVYDAFNNRLLMTLARTGDEINLKGTAPFHVKLGFAQGVTLSFNGEYFDPAPYSHGGVANFTLGE